METKTQITKKHLEMIKAKGGLNSFVELCEFNPDNEYYHFRLYLDKTVFIDCQAHIDDTDLLYTTYAFQLNVIELKNTKKIELRATSFDEALFYLEKKAIDKIVKDSMNAIDNVVTAIGLMFSIIPKNSLLQAKKNSKKTAKRKVKNNNLEQI